jgi:regulation of enolase protein 1 (concanavalin A-like superfamily)/ABC-type transport system involved in multi-copper enzyme maturation permease subunit
VSALAAEWVKFRTVRGWVVAVVIAAAVIAGLALSSGMHGTCTGDSCALPTGPGGEAVTDSLYFVHQQLAGDATITVRVNSLTGQVPAAAGGGMRPGLVPWAKAGIIVKASLAPGSAYAAMMLTGSHGVRMQYDYTGDIAAPAISARWLRLTRHGDQVTGYESADGTRWLTVGSVTLPGRTVQAGLFATSPQYSATSLGSAQVSGGPSQATGTFGDVRLSRTGGAWTGSDIGGAQGGLAGPATGYRDDGGTFTGTGSGDIAPAVSGASGLGVTIAQTLLGTFAALIVLVVVGAMFITAEYRRGLIRVTLAACPRRGSVLAAKAVVTGSVAFAAGLAGSAIAVTAGQAMLRSNGVYVAPVSALTQVRVIVGTAAVLAVCAVIAVAVGTVIRRGAAAIAAVIVITVVPYLLGVAIPVLSDTATVWLMRVTPAAAFAIQQTAVQYHQVDNVYLPSAGYYPLTAWAGFAVLCGWAAAALALAAITLNRRDA